MDRILETIAGISVFNGLYTNQLQEIRKISVGRSLHKGEAVFFEGDPGDGFYVVIEGLIKVFKISADGKEQILHLIGAGEPFGEVAVFAGRSFPANAEALADSRLLFFPRDAIIRLIAQNPAMAMKMLAMLSKRLRQFTVQVENLSLKEVPGRLASYLMVLADEQGQPNVLTLPISKGQLASLLGTIPETLSRIFNKMAAQGLIEVSGRSIRILNREGIEELSEQGKGI
jgi:CRP/FNR family transcriptional regulator